MSAANRIYHPDLYPPPDFGWSPAKPRRDDEAELQKAIVQHLKLMGNPDVIWFHCPSGEHRSKRTGAKLKAMGVVKGVFDLTFILADGRVAFMELKSSKGRLSPEQKLFGEKLDKLGVEWALCAGIDSALAVLKAWGAMK